MTTDQTIVAQTAVQEQPAPAKAKQPRQMVRFTFYKLDSQWQLLPPEQREQGKQQLLQIVEQHGEQALVRAYSLFGLRADCDFMLWQATYDTADLQNFHFVPHRIQEGGVPQTIAQWRYSGKVVQLAFIFRVARTVRETAFIAASAASRFT